MGYKMLLLESKFLIKKEHHESALEAIKNLNGMETAGSNQHPHFMWVQTDDLLRADTLEDALHAWRWSVVLGASSDIIGISDFMGEKYGDEDILFKAIAPFVESGSYIMMAGEDGVLWCWLFQGSTVQKQFGRVVFDLRAESNVRTRYAPGLEESWPHFKVRDKREAGESSDGE